MGQAVATEEAILELFEDSDKPFLTPSDIADAFGITNPAVNKRLPDMVERGDLEREKVGAAAVVYWPSD